MGTRERERADNETERYVTGTRVFFLRLRTEQNKVRSTVKNESNSLHYLVSMPLTPRLFSFKGFSWLPAYGVSSLPMLYKLLCTLNETFFSKQTNSAFRFHVFASLFRT